MAEEERRGDVTDKFDVDKNPYEAGPTITIEHIPRGRPSKLPQRSLHRNARHAAIIAAAQIKEQNAVANEDNAAVRESQDMKCRTPNAVVDALGIPKWVLKHVPLSQRKAKLSELTEKDVRGLQNVLNMSLLSIANILLPEDSLTLYRSFVEDNVLDSKLRGAVVDGIRAAKKGSLEKRMLQSIICATSRAEEVQSIVRSSPLEMFANTNAVLQSELNKSNKTSMLHSESYRDDAPRLVCHVDGCLIDRGNSSGTATGHNCCLCNASVHAYCCERVLGILVVDETTSLYCSKCNKLSKSSEFSNNANPNGISAIQSKRKAQDTGINMLPASKRQASGYLSRLFQQSREEWDIFLCKGSMPDHKRTVTRVSDDIIRGALQYLFRSENIQLLSWGTKRIRVDGKWVNFPAVLRRSTCEKIFRGYKCLENEHDPGAPSNTLSRSSFLQLANTFTRGEQKRKSAVDYVLGALVYDNLKIVREIVACEIENESTKNSLAAQIVAVQEYLKFVYLEHISSDSDPIHDQSFALSKPNGNASEAKYSSCHTCIKPYQVIHNVKCALRHQREDIIDCLTEVNHKMHLYMAHQHRCYNQEQRISALFSDLKGDQDGRYCIILMDYKMKFEAIRYREKTTEFFGKKGLSWHGSVIFFMSRSGHSNLSPVNDDVSTLFFDHLLSNDMKQDGAAVCSIFDAVLARLTGELPQVTNVSIMSDNASCYQNDLFPVMEPFIAKHHNLTLDYFVHSETQRDKSLVDAHFAIAMMHINRYCNETENDVTTPGDVVEALNSSGGVANCTAEMIHLRRDNASLKMWVDGIKGKIMAKLGRCSANRVALHVLPNYGHLRQLS